MGLIGGIIVTDPARARADGTPSDVDREMAALFMIFNEASDADDAHEEADERSAEATKPASFRPSWSESQRLAEEGEHHTINGLVFGNLHGLEMNEGERVRWWMEEIKRLHLIPRDDSASALPISLQVGDAHHFASCALQIAK